MLRRGPGRVIEVRVVTAGAVSVVPQDPVTGTVVYAGLCFLLECRDEPISLQYSPDKEFTLPQNGDRPVNFSVMGR